MFLHNFPLVSFHAETLRVSSDYGRLVLHSLKLTQHFPLLSVFFYSSPFPMALKQANMPALVLCYFALHQWCRKMIQDVTHRHQCSWPRNPCFTQCLCGLFSLLSPKAREDALVEKCQDVKHFPCISFPCHRKAYWRSVRYWRLTVRKVKLVLRI